MGLSFLSMDRFGGTVRGYIYKLGKDGMGYYVNDTARTHIGKVGREVAAEAAANAASSGGIGAADDIEDEDAWLMDTSDEEEDDDPEQAAELANENDPDEPSSSGGSSLFLELPAVEASSLAVGSGALSDLSKVDLAAYNLHNFVHPRGRPGWCGYELTGYGPQVTLSLEEATRTDSVACPALGHARLATLPTLDLDVVALNRLNEPAILRTCLAFSMESELASLQWLRETAYTSAQQLGTFEPPPPGGAGDGSGKLRLAFKTKSQSTGKDISGVEFETLDEFTLSVAPQVAATQRSLLHLCAKLEQATLRSTEDSVTDRTACCVVPLPRGATDIKGVPFNKGQAMVVGGPGRAGPCESIDFGGDGEFVGLPAMPGAAAGCASACAVVAPVQNSRSGKLRPVIIVIGGVCGTRLLHSVKAFDPSWAPGAAVGDGPWDVVRVPPLPPGMARSGAGAAVVVPRSWMLPPP